MTTLMEAFKAVSLEQWQAVAEALAEPPPAPDDVQQLDSAVPYVIVKGDDLLVASVWLLAGDPHRIDHVWVNPSYRHQGLGQQLLKFVIDKVADQAITQLHCQADGNWVSWFEAVGFQRLSQLDSDTWQLCWQQGQWPPMPYMPPSHAEPFTILKAPDKPDYEPRASKTGTNGCPFILGEHNEPVHVTGHDAIINHLVSLINQADEHIRVFSPDLDISVFGHSTVVASLSAFARRNPVSRVDILVADTQPLVHQFHPLFALQQRIPSLVAVHLVHPHYPLDSLGTVLVDRLGWLEVMDRDRYEAVANFNDPGYVKQHNELFRSAWEKSTIPQDFRNLAI
ncbi:GNAT family N-acetyltransferase [Spartinivicinus poritis]|uniref:GNAT family N-acetyltransferase n=1 Tax=Spartinivicinus poritis TaxID=2994640 RepID=A0ABT5U5D6_9GAMM|nr:GNAT family N-acetyltransferase [Spartinivicinus sp. A2-2]MDE1461570.1 GNAT family N-acetyltransferase [Spartinivicinus sp. A2-2]